VLERKEIRRIGTNQMERVDVRVIAATHRDLRAAVNRHEYRDDLYFRLSVTPHHAAPAARAAGGHSAAGGGCRTAGRPARGGRRIAAAGSSPACSAIWPGNVRELRNFLERCLVFRQPLPVKLERRAEAGLLADGRQRAVGDYESGSRTAVAVYPGKMTQAHSGGNRPCPPYR